jgi:hypothetical protein
VCFGLLKKPFAHSVIGIGVVLLFIDRNGGIQLDVVWLLVGNWIGDLLCL